MTSSKIEVVKKAEAATQIIAWSYSRLTAYEECPQKTKFRVIDKLPEPDESKSPALVNGIAVHTAIEQYLKGESEDVSKFKLLADEFKELRALGTQAELEVTFNKDWELTGWFDKDAWLRIKIDGFISKDGVARLMDWKTGKNRGGYEQQLELYALAAMLIDEQCETATGELFFVDSGEIIATKRGAYTRADIPELKKIWIKRTLPMLSDTMFAPRPGNHCRWCNFSKAKGGSCRF
jgi:hypothetical protein